MFELSKEFRFDAAHTLECERNVDESRRIHGHSYRAIITFQGMPDQTTGMVMDLGFCENLLHDIRKDLDHRFLDKVEGLGPATLENLCVWIWRRLAPHIHGLTKVIVARDSSGDACSYYGSGQII